MPPTPRWPVAIVGSGPTGLTLANLLGCFGVPALLIERNPGTVGEPRAVSIDDEALRTLQAAGLVAEVLKHVVPGYGSHYQGPSGRVFIRVEPTGTPYGFPRRNAFRQPRLEAQLREGLARFPQSEAWYGWRLVRFAQDAKGVRLWLEAAAGAAREVACDWLVGCDGAASTVREGLGLRLAGSSFDERWLILDLERHDNPERHTRVFCDPRRPGIALPGPERTRRFEFKLLPGETDEQVLAPETVARLLAEHGADPRAQLVRKVVYRFHARVAERWGEGRVFLAGDAAHLTPPFAGQGMNSGLRDAHNLAWKLAAVVQGLAGPGLLASYEAERRDHVRAMIGLALRMGRIMAPRSAWDGFRTRALFTLLGLLPPARDHVAQMRYKPKPRFAAGFLVPDGRAARRTPVGRLVPQPRVRVAGREVLLDEVLGNRFALLARDAEAVAALRHPLWDRLGVARVAFAGRAPGVTVVEGDAAALDGAGGDVLLLRPDHYVAAAIPAAAPARATASVEALLDATWPRR